MTLLEIQDLKPAYTVELIAKNNTHSYLVRTPDGAERVYPGVTGVLGIISKPALVAWAVREALKIIEAGLMALVGKRKLFKLEFLKELLKNAKKRPDQLKDDAAALGTKFHAYVDAIIRGGAPGAIDNDILRPVMGFDEWWKQAKMTFILGDTKVASMIHEYGGSLDGVCWDEIHQCLVVADWKSSRSIWDEFACQVAAYVRAFEEMYGVKVARAIIVRFDKDGAQRLTSKGFEVAELRNIEVSFQAFLAAKELSELMKFDHLIRDEK